MSVFRSNDIHIDKYNDQLYVTGIRFNHTFITFFQPIIFSVLDVILEEDFPVTKYINTMLHLEFSTSSNQINSEVLARKAYNAIIPILEYGYLHPYFNKFLFHILNGVYPYPRVLNANVNRYSILSKNYIKFFSNTVPNMNDIVYLDIYAQPSFIPNGPEFGRVTGYNNGIVECQLA